MFIALLVFRLMTPEGKGKLLNKQWVGERLRRVRERHGYGTIKAVQDAVKGQPGRGLTGLLRNEDGSAFPGWDTLVVLANACQITLADLVAEIEGKDDKATDKVTALTVKREHKAQHDELEEILSGEDKDAADWISGNLKVFHRDHVVRKRGRAR